MPNSPEEPEPTSGGAPGPDRPPERPGTEPTPAPVITSELPVSNMVQPGAGLQPTPEAGWGFHEEGSPRVTQQALPGTLTWTASEFIDHEKGAGWYALLTLAGIALAGVVYFLTKDILSTAVVLFAALAFGVFAARKPQVQNYSLTSRGLQVGARMYSFQNYKNFSIVPEGAVISIVFMPLRRFMAPLTVYVMPDMEDQVIDFLGGVLPFEQYRTDAVDGLLRRIHF